jgi:hypothetical protein
MWHQVASWPETFRRAIRILSNDRSRRHRRTGSGVRPGDIGAGRAPTGQFAQADRCVAFSSHRCLGATAWPSERKRWRRRGARASVGRCRTAHLRPGTTVRSCPGDTVAASFRPSLGALVGSERLGSLVLAILWSLPRLPSPQEHSKLDCGKLYKNFWQTRDAESYARISSEQLAGISRMALRAYDACQAGDEQDAKALLARLLGRSGERTSHDQHRAAAETKQGLADQI